jgi:hypothetical protein
MISSRTIHAGARRSRIAIRHGKLRLTLHFRARLPERDAVPNPVIAHAAIGSQQKHGRSKGHAL